MSVQTEKKIRGKKTTSTSPRPTSQAVSHSISRKTENAKKNTVRSTRKNERKEEEEKKDEREQEEEEEEANSALAQPTTPQNKSAFSRSLPNQPSTRRDKRRTDTHTLTLNTLTLSLSLSPFEKCPRQWQHRSLIAPPSTNRISVFVPLCVPVCVSV